MARKASLVLVFLLSVLLLDGEARQGTPIPRLGIEVTASQPVVWIVGRDSSGARAGIKVGDELVSVDGQAVARVEAARQAIETAMPGTHQLRFLRNGKLREVTVDTSGDVRRNSLPMGLMLIQGVRVLSMERGAPARDFEVREGDRVTGVRINGQLYLSRTPEELARVIAAAPANETIQITSAHGDTARPHDGQLRSAPTADAETLAEAPSVGQPRGGAAGRGAEPPAPASGGMDRFAGGERQGDYARPPRQAMQEPAAGGRGMAARGGASAGDSTGRMAQRLQGMRMRGVGAVGASAQRNATLDQLLTPVSYRPPASVSKRMAEINVLKYAFIDRKTGDVVFVGTYDPAYATGPIPYEALLADAVQNPYPRFTLEYPGSGGQSPLATFRARLDQEFARIAHDPTYGTQWLGRLILPVLKGDSQDPDQRAALEARLKAIGIAPAAYSGYMKWQLSGFKDMQGYYEGGAAFLSHVTELAGLGPKVGAEITAYRRFATEKSREAFEDWCRIAGYSDLLARMDQQVKNGGSRDAATETLMPALYGSMLRGLGMSDGEVNQAVSSYQRQGGNEAALVAPLEQRYQAVFQQFLTNKLVNGMSFTGATLSAQYNFPPIMSPLNTYGARRDSPIMHVFFQADYILKFMTSSPRPAGKVPGHESSQQYLSEAENRAGASAGRTPDSGVNRYWFYPESVGMDTLAGNAGVRFRDARIRVGVEMLQSEGADRTGEAFYQAALQQYSQHLTSLYQQYARLYPMLHTLQETEKVVALARWAQKNGVPVHVQAEGPPTPALPDSAQGFWGMTYIVRPTGSTDTVVTWAEGGVDFGQQGGDAWVQAGLPDRQVTDDALRSLAASTALSEKAAAAAGAGDLESARNLAERSAQAMSGNIDLTGLPQVPVPSNPTAVPEPAAAAEVSQAAIEAVDANAQAMQQAKAGLAQAASLQATDPARAEQIHQQSLQMQQRSEEDLARLQTMLQQYRGAPATGYQVAVDLRNLDPNRPATVGLTQPAAPTPAPAAPPPAAATSPRPAPAAAANEPGAVPCDPGIAAVMPSRPQIQAELTSRRIELENLRNVIERLNRNIQLDQKEFDVWQAEAEEAITRLNERKADLWREAGFGLMTYGLDTWVKYDGEIWHKLTPADLEALERKRKILENTKDAGEFARWALSDKKDWEMIEGGVRLLFDAMPLTQEAKAIVKGSQAIIDNIYDAADFQVTWDNVNRLNRNSDQYLQAVRQNGERVKALVTRIRELEVQLRTAPAQPQNASPCAGQARGQGAR